MMNGGPGRTRACAAALLVVFAILLPAWRAAAVATRDFTRYEVILSRRPFGYVPPDETIAAVVPVPTTPSFAERLQMVAITMRGERIRVGFIDRSENPPRTYFLFVGQPEGGYEVIEADYAAGTALVRRDGQQATISMARGSAGPDGAGPQRGGAGAGGGASVSASRRQSRPRQTVVRSPLTREQYEAEREAGLRGAPAAPTRALRQNADAPSMTDLPPALREHAVRQYNMELIRAQGEKGLPLPIALTPEEDAQLVREGVLEP